MWTVHYYVSRRETTYTGKGSQSHFRRFNDQPSANRFAQDIVEAGPASFAEVIPSDDKNDPKRPATAERGVRS